MFFYFHHFRFHLEPKAPLHMPAHNKGNVIRGGFGSTFQRVVCHGDWQERVREPGRDRENARWSRRLASCGVCVHTRDAEE